MQDTKWREISEFPGYIVSDQGHVAKLISPQPNEKGYLRVAAIVNGKRVTRYVHRLVAKAWIHNPENKLTVNHKNMNVADNRVSNLEWMTNNENMRHSWENNPAKRIGDHRGHKNGKAKLTQEQVNRIRERYAAGERCAAIAIDYGVTISLVWQIARRKVWAHI